ncbi:MAG: dihydroorotase [Bacillota bacterium]|nr:dihydroorotase [Bacillota bacterium]
MKDNLYPFVRIKDLDTAARERLGSCGIDFSLFSNYCILPGFTDVHVHLREPGFLYKETIRTGTLAAAAGGFTCILAMPNLDPCPDSMENLRPQQEAIAKDACIKVLPYGAITVGEKGRQLSDMERLAPHVVAFTDDGMGVASDEFMERAMERARSLNKLIVAHCEDESYPKESSEAEYKQLERDLTLVRKTGCSYHMCHVSTRESLQLIRDAKKEGLDVTCETAPHYLTISREEIPMDDLQNGGRFKMNPPIKSAADRRALIEALRDGTIDMIATDHAPHSAEEKSKGFYDSAFGIVGLETAFPVLYTQLVLKQVISPEKLIELLYTNPRKRFGLPVADWRDTLKNPVASSSSDKGNFAIWDLDTEYQIDPSQFLSKGHSTPFEGWHVKGRCLLTVSGGKVVWQRGQKR